MKAVLSFGEIKELLRSDKAVKIIMIAGAVIMIMIALGGVFGGSSGKSANAPAYDLAGYEHALEERLAKILSDIDGVGNISVMITLDTSEKTEYGKNPDMLLSVTAPKVRGVIVVCDGGDSITVKEKVTEAVKGVFGISTAHISVTK